MDIFHFILKYTPFWAIPLMMICGEFGYVYWLKSIKDVAKTFFTIAVICFFFLVYYIWAGGPDRVVEATQSGTKFISKEIEAERKNLSN